MFSVGGQLVFKTENFKLNCLRRSLLFMVKPAWQNCPHGQSICPVISPYWNPRPDQKKLCPLVEIAVLGVMSEEYKPCIISLYP